MENQDYTFIMSSSFGIMHKIMKYIEKSMDDTVFNEKDFTAKNFNISENRFARLLDTLVESGYVTGIEIIDYNEPDPIQAQDKNYKRFDIKIDNPEITVDGMRFMAENTMLMKTWTTIKSVKDLLPI